MAFVHVVVADRIRSPSRCRTKRRNARNTCPVVEDEGEDEHDDEYKYQTWGDEVDDREGESDDVDEGDDCTITVAIVIVVVAMLMKMITI
eukprot:9319959-Pyramimonas_sp.AAC.1